MNYLADVVGNLSAFLSIMGGIIIVVVGMPFSGYLMDVHKFGKKALLLPAAGILLLFLSVFIPSKQTIYLMAGGYVTQEVVTSDTAKKVLEILNEKLDTELEGLKSKKK